MFYNTCISVQKNPNCTLQWGLLETQRSYRIFWWPCAKNEQNPILLKLSSLKEMVPGSTNVEVNFEACLNQELKKVAKDGRAITKDNKDLKSVIQREMLLWDNEGIRGPNLNFAYNSLRHIQCTSTESG